jgi:two-component system response regulator FixJ
LTWIISDCQKLPDNVFVVAICFVTSGGRTLNVETYCVTDDRVVAVVDDDLAVLDSIKFLLELEGHKVRTYSSGAGFLKDRPARPRCLITDQHMPGLTGLDLVARLRGEGINIPTLLITGLSSPAIGARAAQLGIEAVIDKPPGEDELLQVVRSYA